MSTTKKYVLGRGCDPVRARFAKQSWEPVLNCEIDTATSDEEFRSFVTSGKKYDVFFIAPGQCSLIRSGRVDANFMKNLIATHQPQCKSILIPDVSQALPLLAEALGSDKPIPGVAPLTQAWPFID